MSKRLAKEAELKINQCSKTVNSLPTPISHSNREGLKMVPVSELPTGRGRAGYSLIEILCVVGFLAMIAAIALPSLFRARNKSQATACIDQLRQLQAAQQQWIIETKPSASTKIKKKDLQPYFKNGQFPVCPSGGDYKLGTPSEQPECSLDKSEGHKL